MVLGRAHSDKGATTVQYALLVALVALVVAILISALGSGVKGLFGTAHTCLSGLTTTACKVGPAVRGSTDPNGP
jgi:Flp pilus assembly pilin Flp